MSEAPDLTGRTLDGRYRITRLLGMGGMGHVYAGVHVILGRKIAIKTLHPRLVHEARFRERFLREAKSASSIEHPNVVQIMDFGTTPDGSAYFIMEYLEGRDLAALLREQGRLTWPRAREILLQAVRALTAAHAHDIIHRDIKPGNCFLTESGPTEVVKLLDFGIAKMGSDEAVEGAERLTGTGEVFGTATYMAPEQALGEPLDARSDVYSLGVMAYEMLTGNVPFRGATPVHVITKHLRDRPKPPRQLEPSIPAAVEALVLRAMAKDPKHRFASMLEVEAALRAITADGSVREATESPSTSGLPWIESPPEPTTRAQATVPRIGSSAQTIDLGPRSIPTADAPTAAVTQPSATSTDSTRPLPGRVDHSTAPLLPFVVASSTGSLAQQSGAATADTSVDHLEPVAALFGRRGAALVVGAFALVIVMSTVITLSLLVDPVEPAADASTTLARAGLAGAITGVEQTPKERPGPSSSQAGASAEPSTSSTGTKPSTPSMEDASRGKATDAATHTTSGTNTSEGSIEKPTGAGSKRPLHLTPACIDRRARATAALDARAWREVLTATSVTACWSTAEQAARRSMRVTAYLDLGEFGKCAATGRGVRDEQTQREVKRCQELLEQ